MQQKGRGRERDKEAQREKKREAIEMSGRRGGGKGPSSSQAYSKLASQTTKIKVKGQNKKRILLTHKNLARHLMPAFI